MKKIIVTPNGTQEIELTTEEISQREIDTANALLENKKKNKLKHKKTLTHLQVITNYLNWD
jgi:hypothetical protein